MTHHELGASGAHRWTRCPGSVALSRGVEDPGSEFSREGDAAHLLASICLSGGHLPYVFPEVAGYPVDAEMVQAISAYIEAVRSPDFVRTVFALSPFDEPVLVTDVVEYRVDLGPWLPGVGSTLDHCGVWRVGSDHFAVVTDLKYGAGEFVSAKDNHQTRIYVGGFLSEYDHLFDFTALAGVVFQPRRFGPSWETYTPCEVRRFMADLVPLAAATQETDAPVIPGHAQCRWCPVKGRCKARAAWLTQAMRFGPSDAAPMYPELLSPEEIAEMLPYVSEYKDLMRGIEAEGLRLALERSLPGYKAIGTLKDRSWDEDAAKATLAEHAYSIEEFTVTKFASVAQVEKKLGRKLFEEILGHLVQRLPGGPKLVRSDDPRPEYGADMFED